MLWKRECGKENEEHQWDWDFEQRSEGRPYPGDFIVTVQLLSRVLLFATPWTAVHQAPLFFTISWSLLKLMSIESVMPSNHLILCRPLFLPPSIFPSIRVFSNESALHIRWPKYWSFSFSLSPSNEYSGLISLRIDWLDLLTVQGLSRIFSSRTVRKHQSFGTQPFYDPTLTSISLHSLFLAVLFYILIINFKSQ